MRNEADVKDAVKKVLNSFEELFWYMPVQTGYGVKGIPDFIICAKGTFIGVETKFGSNKESSWQKITGAKIAAAGGHYMVINEKNISELEGWVRNVSGA